MVDIDKTVISPFKVSVLCGSYEMNYRVWQKELPYLRSE